MTEHEAKAIINGNVPANPREHIEAIHKAEEVLGDSATMADIWAWAEGRLDDDSFLRD